MDNFFTIIRDGPVEHRRLFVDIEHLRCSECNAHNSDAVTNGCAYTADSCVCVFELNRGNNSRWSAGPAVKKIITADCSCFLATAVVGLMSLQIASTARHFSTGTTTNSVNSN